MKSVLSATLAVIALAASGGVFAADSTNADATPATAEAKAKMKPHSHMEEKMGAVASNKADPEKKQAAKKNSTPDKSKHFHPRDGK